MTRRRLDRWLTVVDVIYAARDHVAERIRGARCPICWERTRQLVAHVAVDHADGR